MKKTFLIVLFLIAGCFAGFGQIRYFDKGTMRFNFDFNYQTSSSFFDVKDNLKIFETDTFNIMLNDTTPYQYNLKHSYELRKYKFFLGFDYSLTDNLFLGLSLPLSFITYVNKYEKDTNWFSPTLGRQVIRGEYSAFLPEYYGLYLFYRLNKGLINTSIHSFVKVPSNLETGYQLDTNSNLLIYSAYEFAAGITNTFIMETGFLELETTYNSRGGIFSDMFFVRLEGGFTTVPNTVFKGIINYGINLDDFSKYQPVNHRKTTLQETYIDAGASFGAIINKNLFVDFAYLLRLGTTNTLSYGTLILKTSYVLN